MSSEILERLLPYVPPFWVQQAWAESERTLAGRQDRLQAAVLFCDISGFTPIAEALSRRGREGIEELTALLDRYLASMSELVVALGGQVAKFAGDSLIALFPRADAEDTHLGSALWCALRMRQAMSEFARLYTSAGTFPIQCKIGISEGSVYATTVGDEENGMLPVFAGRSILRAMLAEDTASAGEIVVDAMLIGRLPGHLDVGEARGTFRLIEGAIDIPVLPALQPVDLSALDQARVEQLVRRLSPYLASQVIERIYRGARGVYSEHRRVTVMFVRFEGPDYDASPGDGMSVGEVLQVYFTTMRDCVLRHGGRLNEVDITVGGGVLVALFGALTAHEDDELRAVSCAWEMQRAIADVRSVVGRRSGGKVCSSLRQCVSISSGVLFAGDVGGRVRRAFAVVGDEVNLASRLSNLAGWGETLVTSWIRWRTGGRFEYETRGEVEIRGKAERVPLGLLRAPRPLGEGNNLLARLLNRRFLVGRGAELAAIEAVGMQARRGEPQLLFLSGEAGVGKSRLAGELVHEWMQRDGIVYAIGCAAVYNGHRRQDDRGRHNGAAGNGAYVLNGPWIALLRAVFGLEASDSVERRRLKIEAAWAALVPQAASWRGFIEDLLDPKPAGEGSFALPMKQQRAHLCQALVSLIAAKAQDRPLLLVLEGVHQLEPDSRTLFHEFLHAIPALPVLVCATSRPTGGTELEGLPSQGARIATTRLVLEPLAEADSFYLAQHLLRDVGLQMDLAPAVVSQARGNSLYLYEMIRALADSGCPAETLAQGLIVPDRIANTVLAQLDSLGEDSKLTLHIAAVIGQTFSLRLLRAAHPVSISRHDLAVRMARLERMHVVRLYHMAAGADAPDVYYRFRHALAQRVIYASLLRADRERFHRRVGRALEKVSSEMGAGGTSSVGVRSVHDLETSYGLLAEHFQKGNELSKAIIYALLAGQCAARDRAVREALMYYGWVQDLLLAYEASASAEGSASAGYAAARLRRCVQGVRCSLLLGRGSVHYQLLDIAKARADYEQALKLARDLADVKSQADALLRLGVISMRQADYIRAQTLIHQALQRLSVLDEPESLARARLFLGQIAALRGGLEVTTHYVALAADAWRHRRGPDSRSGRIVDVYQEWLGTVFTASRSSPALKSADEPSLRSDEDLECLLLLAEIAVQRGDWGNALDLARRGIALGWALGTPLDVADAKRVLAWLLVRAGAYQEASDYVDEALTTFAEANWTTGLADGYWLAGEVLLALERYELAAERFDQALTIGKETHTVQAIVRAQIGMGKLAALHGQWQEGQRLYTEARARAVWAKLGSCAMSARLGLARTYLGCREWQLARGQAKQALDMGLQLDFPGDVLDAACILGEALSRLDQVECAEQRFEQAYKVALRLADTLPIHYASAFWSQPSLRSLCERVACSRTVDLSPMQSQLREGI